MKQRNVDRVVKVQLKEDCICQNCGYVIQAKRVVYLVEEDYVPDYYVCFDCVKYYKLA